MKHLYYLWYVLRHKWFVFLACWSLGLRWRGLVHDNSKFLPREFFPYARHFYGKKPPVTGYIKVDDPNKDPAFDAAWLHHQRHNDHHWEWWQEKVKGGGVRALEMGEAARWEMLCDWWGAGRAQLREEHQGWKSTQEWYEKNKSKMLLHAKTRLLVEQFLHNAVEG